MDTSCTLLLSSYDGGEDLWEGFFKALTIQWPQMDLPIVLNTESKSYSFPGLDIKTFSLYPDTVPHWGERLIETLKRIDSEYILFFLEDFWLNAPVDDAFFRKCLNYMRENQDVATLSFKPTYGTNIKDNRFERFERRPQKPKEHFHYRLNCQVAIWRRERLIEFILPFEDPWQWEFYGSMRSTRYQDGFYTLIEGEQEVFSYDDGNVVHRGKWDMDVAKPLCERYGLDIDFSARGILEDAESQEKPGREGVLWGIYKWLHGRMDYAWLEIRGLRSWLFR